mgnify:CR=1
MTEVAIIQEIQQDNSVRHFIAQYRDQRDLEDIISKFNGNISLFNVEEFIGSKIYELVVY